jgi:hypothetical protein
MSTQVAVTPTTGKMRLLGAGLLAVNVVVLGFAANRFHPHLVMGGIWMILSAAALTVSMIDYLRQSPVFETRIIVTTTILCLTVGFLLKG